MRSLFKKGQGLPWKLILTLIIGLVSLLILLGMIGAARGVFTPDFFKQSSCWMSNTLSCGGGAIAGAIPNFCELEYIEEGVDMEEFSKMIRNTWWEYKQNECDFGVTYDEVYPVYAFTPKEDISLGEYFEYILYHNRGEKITDVAYSDYNYLESGTPGLTLCFDNRDEDWNSIDNLILEEGDVYYIMYYDNQEENINDMVLITEDPTFDAGYWASKADFATYATAGATGAVLAVGTGGTAAIVYVSVAAAAGGVAGIESGLTIWGDAEGGCVAYGPSTPGDIAVAHGEQTIETNKQ